MAQNREVRIRVDDEECDEQEKWGKHCIYKLPACVTDLKKSAYKPRAISFGPYHNGNPKLRPMECHKSRVLKLFLKRAGKTLDRCISDLSGDAEELMDAYGSLDRKWIRDPESFLRMMVRDGCFMLEIMAYYSYSEHFKKQYDEKKDPIFSSHAKIHMMPFIMRDMLLLENQLPKSFLIRLLSLGGHPKPDAEEDGCYIINLIVNFCSPFTNPVRKHEELKTSKHVLDLYRKLLIAGTITEDPKGWPKLRKTLAGYYYDDPKPPSNDRWKDEIDEYGANIIPSATRLRDACIKIRKSDSKSITNINFRVGLVGGVLEIPQVTVDDTTEPVFLNLMAFERLHPDTGCDVTSYVTFMDDIIDNVQDVKILTKHEIVSNAYGSDMAVANLFNSLTKDTTVDRDNDLVLERYQVKKHCKGKCNKLLGDLMQNYFSNPWAYLVVLATLLAFGLGITDTVFSIKQNSKRAAAPPPPPPANISSLLS